MRRPVRGELFLQHLVRLRQSQMVWYSLEFLAIKLLLFADALEEECLARHVHIEYRQLPIPWSNGLLLHVEAPAFIQMPQQSSQKLHAICQMSADFRQSVLLLVDP